jgi:hypothetical protein
MVTVAKPAAKKVAAKAPTEPVKASQPPAPAPVAAAPAAPAEETHVNIELIHGHSYATLKKTYNKGEVYRVPVAVWNDLRKDRESMTGRPYFAQTKRKPTDTILADAADAGSTDGKGTGITITHTAPQPMSARQLRESGLSAWEGNANLSPEIDTGAQMVGKDDVSPTDDDGNDGEGHEGLDDGESDDLAAAGLAPAPQPPGPRNAAAKASLGVPKAVVPRPTQAAPLGDDEVQV